MNVQLVITTMNRPAELVKAVEAALLSDLPLAGITVIDNSPDNYAQGLVGDTAFVITLPHAAGLGPCLNLAFALYDDYLICQNDDVVVHTSTLRALVDAADGQPENSLFYGNHDDESMFSLFLLRKQAFLEVGGFDPSIWPIYYDDIDFLRRFTLLGYSPVTVASAVYGHVKNATINAFDAPRRELHDRQFARNEEYYRLKWGGLKFKETFVTPFNGERPVVSPLIKV